MDGKLLIFYGWIVLGIYFLWLFIKLAIPKIKEVHAMNDNYAWFKESTITHKVSELLIWVPSFFLILFSFYRPTSFLLNFLDYTEEIMFIGGIIGLYSIIDAVKKGHWWAYPFILIALMGIFAGWLGRNMFIPMLTY